MTDQPNASSPWDRATASAAAPASAGRERLARRAFERLYRPHRERQSAFNEAVLGALVEIRNELAEQIRVVRQSSVVALLDENGAPVTLEEEILRLRRAVDIAAPVIQHQGWAIDALRGVVDDQLLEREVVSQEIDLSRQQAFARFHDGVGQLRAELSELSRALFERADAAERRLERAERQLTSARLRLAELDPAPARTDGQASPEPAALDVAGPARSAERFGELYASFEDRFRGSEGLIKERVAGYLGDLEPLKGRGRVLDVGCGRGDFLEVLAEHGLDAYGIEVSTGYARHWELNELDVRIVEVREHLQSLDKESLAAISALQVVEHITTDELLEFLELSFAALRPDGLLVLETPNPENLSVGAATFYLDPTHDRPIPAGLLAFLVESRGFVDVEIRFLRRPELHGLPEISAGAPWAEDLEPVRTVVNHALFSAQDYAIVARRP